MVENFMFNKYQNITKSQLYDSLIIARYKGYLKKHKTKHQTHLTYYGEELARKNQHNISFRTDMFKQTIIHSTKLTY